MESLCDNFNTQPDDMRAVVHRGSTVTTSDASRPRSSLTWTTCSPISVIGFSSSTCTGDGAGETSSREFTATVSSNVPALDAMPRGGRLAPALGSAQCGASRACRQCARPSLRFWGAAGQARRGGTLPADMSSARRVSRDGTVGGATPPLARTNGVVESAAAIRAGRKNSARSCVVRGTKWFRLFSGVLYTATLRSYR